MSKIGFIIFFISLVFQLFFSLYYSRTTFSLNLRFQHLLTRIEDLELDNNRLLVQIATFSAMPVNQSSTSAVPTLNLNE